MNTLTERITKHIQLPLQDMGLQVVCVRMMGEDKNLTLQIMIDTLGGVPVDVNMCEKASHVISAVLDVENPISQAYTLEVSTPGIDRPLVCAKDWQTYVGHAVRVKLKVSDGENTRGFKGKILAFTENTVTLDVGGVEKAVALHTIHFAQLILTDALIAFCQERLNRANMKSIV